MPAFIANFHLDRISFWVGVVTGALLFWFIATLRQILPKLRETIRGRSTDVNRFNNNAAEEKLRKETLRQAQGMHLSAEMFSLDEILVPPKLLAPLPQVVPGGPIPPEDAVTQTIAYMPEWPELAARYGSPTLDLHQPIKQGLNIVIVGQPGSGKSTALAYLASQISRRECPDPALNEYLPLLIHVADLGISPKMAPDPGKTLVNVVAKRFPTANQPQIVTLVQTRMAEGKLLLLLDGLDDLPPYAIRETSAFLDTLLKQNPNLHLVTTASPDFFGSLLTFDIRPFALAAWGETQLETFVGAWEKAWEEWIIPQTTPMGQVRTADLALVGHWMASADQFYTPLEWTLITWAAFAGDSRGSTVRDAIDAYLFRHNLSPFRPMLEQLAVQSILDSRPVFNRKLAESILQEYASAQIASQALDDQVLLERLRDEKPASTTAETPAPGFDISRSGIFLTLAGDQVRFIHAVIGGYLAGCGLANGSDGLERLTTQQTWSGKSLALRFLGASRDISAIIDPYLKDVEGPLYRNLMIVSRWIKDAPNTMKWRTSILQSLTGLVQKDELPMAVRERVLSAILCSEDENLPVLFREMMFTNSALACKIGAIGCGAIRDEKSVDGLIVLLSNPDQMVRKAACLALVAIGSQPALEAVTKVLIQADENSRRAAAEALANNRRDGFEILKDGSISEDILIRRAVVFGLSRIREEWAREILEKMRIEDSQWIIRNAAAEAIESSQGQDPYLPQLMPPPAQSPWLVEYAANQGTGIPGGSDARELLLYVFQSGREEESLAALDYLRLSPDPEVIGPIYQAVWTGTGSVREAALAVLWEFSASGVTLYSPSAYGVQESSALLAGS